MDFLFFHNSIIKYILSFSQQLSNILYFLILEQSLLAQHDSLAIFSHISHKRAHSVRTYQFGLGCKYIFISDDSAQIIQRIWTNILEKRKVNFMHYIYMYLKYVEKHFFLLWSIKNLCQLDNIIDKYVPFKILFKCLKSLLKNKIQ